MTLEELVHINYDKLNEGDLEIWEYIFNHKMECAGMTIEQCAAMCNVSRTTILRFAKKLSLSGYTEFKYLLKSETAINKVSGAGAGVGIDMRELTYTFAHLIEDLPTRDFDTFNQLMDGAGRVFLVPSGHTQSVAVMEIQNLLTVYTTKTVLVADSRSRRNAMLNTIESSDLVMFVSQSGENEMLEETARELKWKRVPIITFTQVKSNPMSQLADLPIYYPVKTFQGIGENGYTSIGGLYVVIEFYLANYFNHAGGIGESGSSL